MVTTRDNRDEIRVLLYSYYSTITGRGVLLSNVNDIRLYKGYLENRR